MKKNHTSFIVVIAIVLSCLLFFHDNKTKVKTNDIIVHKNNAGCQILIRSNGQVIVNGNCKITNID